MGRLRVRLLSVFLTVAVLGLAPAEARDRDVTVDDVIRLAQSGISDKTMIAFLDTQSIGFAVDADVLLQLRSAGVSEAVIRSLLERARPSPVPPRTYAAPVAPLYGYPVSYPRVYYAYPRVYYAAPVRVFSFGLPHWRHGRAFVRHHHHHHHGRAFVRRHHHHRHHHLGGGIAASHFSIVAGHRTLSVGRTGHAARHVRGHHAGHGRHRGHH